MKRLSHLGIWFVLVTLCSSLFCVAGIRSAGKYSGVVIFDRWDGCILYSGVFVMYVSEKVKEGLRQYQGQAIQIDAKEVYQPMNPGDGLIKKFEYIGPARETRSWVTSKGIRLESSMASGDDGKAIARIVVENEGTNKVSLFSDELALTVLVKLKDSGKNFGPWDGPSMALITRQSLGKKQALPHDFILAPKEKKTIDVKLDLPDGEYELLSGYGGGVHEGRCVAGNLSGFNIENGRLVVIREKSK